MPDVSPIDLGEHARLIAERVAHARQQASRQYAKDMRVLLDDKRHAHAKERV